MSKIVKISIFSLICVIFIGTLFVNLNNDVESYENEKSQKQQEIYTIKEYDGKIAVYKNGENKPMEVYESYVSLLPEADRQKLQNGLTVDKANSEMKTTISDNGMTIRKNSEEVLVANNVGVNAKNLHATTYLIIGNNSRFEDYGTDRTGCFWIGGNS